jgi:hypothetical protein
MLILLNYQPIIVRVGSKGSPTYPTRNSARDYILITFSI